MAPKTREQNEEIRQKTTGSIKEAALELFGKFGYHSTSISQIAKAAGVSKGLMYNYFEGKEALLHEILLEAVDEGEELMKVALSYSDDPYEQLEQIVDISIKWVTENLHHWKLLTSLAFQMDVLKGLESVMQEKQEIAVKQMVDLFQRMGVEKPLEEAMTFGAILDGMMLHYMQMEDNYPMEAMKKHILEKFNSKKQL
jgi:AcrR family transcriptional regulator